MNFTDVDILFKHDDPKLALSSFLTNCDTQNYSSNLIFLVLLPPLNESEAKGHFGGD